MLSMVILKKPLKVDKYEFMMSHLDCDIIVEKVEGTNGRIVNIIAYAENKSENKLLRLHFKEMGYSGKYKIQQGISKSEVNSID